MSIAGVPPRLMLTTLAFAILLPGACTGEGAGPDSQELEEGELLVEDTCNVDDPGQNCIEVADGVVTLDELPGLQSVTFDVSRQAAILAFAPGSSQPPALKEGAVIYKRRGARKFLRRIVSVTQTASGFELVTERVRVRDAIKRMRLVGDFALDLERGVAIPVETAALSAWSGLDETAGALSRRRSGTETLLETPNVEASIDWEWSYDIFVTVRALFGLGKNDESEVTLNGEFDAYLGASVAVTGAFDRKAEIRVLNFAPVPIGLVTLDIDVFAGVNLAGSGELEAEVGYRGQVDIAAGFKTAPHGGISTTFFDEDPTLEREGPTISGAGLISGRVYLEPEIGIGWDPVVEGTIGAEIYAKLDLSGFTVSSEIRGDDIRARREFCTDLSFGVSPELGLSGFFNLVDEEWQLATVSVSAPGFPTCEIREEIEFGAVSYCDIAADAKSMPPGVCLQPADCGGGNVHPCMVPVCNANCSCEYIRLEQGECCITEAWREAHPGAAFRPGEDYTCDDEDPRTLDTCVDERCRFERIPNACLNAEEDCLDFGVGAEGGEPVATCLFDRPLPAGVESGPARGPLPPEFEGDEVGVCSYHVLYTLPPEPDERVAPILDDCDVLTERVDCDDGDFKTRDWCLEEGGPLTGECRHTPKRGFVGDPLTCEAMNCDDGDPATRDSCADGACVHERVAAFPPPPLP